MKKVIYTVIMIIILISGLLIIAGFFDPVIINWVLNKIGRSPGFKSMLIFKYFGFGLIIFSALLAIIIFKRNFIRANYESRILPLIKSFDAWLERFNSKWINSSQKHLEIRWNHINRLDWIFIFLALIVSFLLIVERLQGNYPDVILGSDAANISSMAVSLNHPDLFENDFYLQNPDNFKLYLQIHVVIIRSLGKLINNYTLPFVFILGPTAFVTLIGNYWLGRTVLNNRFWAVLFVIFNSIPVYLLFENWGLAEDSVPRTFMQAALPFLLALIWIWKDSPKKWPVIAILTGLLTYIHAVGTPTIMAMVILSLLWMMPNTWPLKKKLFIGFLLSLIMIIVGSIFIINYLSIKQQVLPFDYETIMKLYHTYFPPNIMDVKTSVGLLLKFYWESWILPLGLVGLFILWFCQDNSRRLTRLMVAWLVGIAIVSVFFPYVERIIEAYLRILPIETELIRGTRFFVPVLGMISLACLSHVFNLIKFKSIKLILIVIGIIFIGHYFSYRSTNLLLFEKTRACISKGKFLCTEKSDLQNLLAAIDERTPTITSIYYANDSHDTLPLAVRYVTNRSLVYSWKDRGMGFSHPEKMLQWHELFSEIDQYSTSTEWYLEHPETFLKFIQKLDADYFVLQKNNQEFEVDHGILIYENPSFLLLQVDK